MRSHTPVVIDELTSQESESDIVQGDSGLECAVSLSAGATQACCLTSLARSLGEHKVRLTCAS